MKKSNFSSIFFILIGVLLNLLSIYLYWKDKNLTNQWLILFLWLVSIFISLIPLIFSIFDQSILLKSNKKEVLFLIVLIILSSVLRFYKIQTIPILNGDETRDAGLIPESFLKGEIKDFFGYGVYGISNMFFILTSIPHFLFGNTILAIRFFSAFFGILSVILVYFLNKKMFGKKMAIVSAILLSTYHVHLQFSRSEFINLFDSFWAPLIMIFLWQALKKEIYLSLVLAVILGLATHFYQGIRAVIFFCCLYFVIINVINYYRTRNWRIYLIKIIHFFIGLLLGLGPSVVILVLRRGEFFNTGTAGRPFSFGQNSSMISDLINRFSHSFGSMIYYPIDFHYKYGGPFLTLPFNLFFIIGLILILKNIKQQKNQMCFFWLFAVVFFNSTILPNINFTHRLLSLVPILMTVTGLGIIKLTDLFSIWPKLRNPITIVILLFFITINLKSYFIDSVWKKAYDLNTKTAVMAGYYYATFPSKKTFYFIISLRGSIFKDASTWIYLAPNRQVKDIPIEQVKTKSFSHKETVFIVVPENITDLKTIKEIYPSGLEKNHYFDQEFLFTSYELE